MSGVLTAPRIRIDDRLAGSAGDDIAAVVRDGLTRSPLKELPPKLFYDDHGSELFDQITQLPEYYPTRCERSILNRRAPEIVAATGAEELIELGSGSASKTRALLFAMAGAGTLRRYVPVDVSAAPVERSARELCEIYPGLEVHGLIGDFMADLGHLPDGERRLLAFLGGTVGNFFAEERIDFLAELRDLMGPDDRLLLGTDLVKDAAVLEAAYDDSAGVTAEFNRNVLRVVNRELDADFRLDRFEHRAFFDAERSWIEMRLRSLDDVVVRVPGAGIEVAFDAGEEIRTEISTKFTPERVEQDLRAADLALEDFWTDDGGQFGLSLASPA
ncbi:MAG: L-histidine Nalpha-methyltransferase [Thermoleophilaceae bacterium]|nr:L-histidine Nalpha-methyltransferase [Thermoleophilaceae bacterium]MEA2352725.1 L-histidine Nalpha-methyltransferase [Thermoleophilaceae bacterium]MEA2387607.1 L-histidine Nalpha-methyltransferase [Thermoleophilaceae bacterium]